MVAPLFNIVLVSPEIPGNTGNVGRTCLALNLRLILIHPLGFALDEKSVRRAGLDYWKHVRPIQYKSWQDFEVGESPSEDRLFLLTKSASTLHYQGNYVRDCYLVLGCETAGLPEEVLGRYPRRHYKLPLFSPLVRSLNLSNAACAAAYEVVRQLKYTP